MIKSSFKAHIFKCVTPLSLILILYVTLKLEVKTDGGYSRLYGFPFSFITNNYGGTGHFNVYILPLLMDFLLSFLCVFILFKVFKKDKYVFSNKFAYFLYFLALVPVVCFFFWSNESEVFWLNPETYEILSRDLYFGIYPFMG